MFEYFFTAIKGIFIVAILVSLVNFRKIINQFHSNDVGIVQKYIHHLMVTLFLFNDPLSIFFVNNKQPMYALFQSIVESTFISLLFFFWLLLLHSIAQ
jgi:hypothetical protein